MVFPVVTGAASLCALGFAECRRALRSALGGEMTPQALVDKPSLVMFELSEVVTGAVRHALRNVAGRRQSLAFDFRGEQAWVRGDELALRCSLHRLLCATFDLLSGRLLLVDGEAGSSNPAGPTAAHIRIGGNGSAQHHTAVDDFMARLQLKEPNRGPAREGGWYRHAKGACPRTGGRIDFDCSQMGGFLVRFSVELDRAPIPGSTLGVHAAHARAWVIDVDPLSGGALERRLRKAGWATTGFPSTAQALRRLREMPAPQARPALVIAVETQDAPQRDVLELADSLPAYSGLMLLAQPGSPSLAMPPDRHEKLRISPMPLSPADIAQLTAEFAGRAQKASGATHPAPLGEQDTISLLIVDDDEVNRVVAGAMAESMGCRVRFACDGAQAIEICRSSPPELVLMDISMPVMNGIDATIRLRDLQRSGRIPPFPIVAVTTEVSPSTRRTCFRAGMDGFLAKPLSRAELHAEIQRLAACRRPGFMG